MSNESIDESLSGTPFNMAMIYYMNLNQLIIEKDRMYMNNNIYGWFKGLDRIFNIMIFKIDESKDDIKEIEDKFKSVRDLIDKNNKKDCVPILHEIDKKLMRLMHKYHMIFPNIETAHGINKVYKRYDLGGKK